MHKLFLPVAAMIALAACQGNTAKTNDTANTDSLKVDSMQTAVLNIHDEGMEKMMVIRRLKTRSTEIVDSLKSKKNNDTTAYSTTIALLDSANNAMNNWMHSYDMKQEGKTTEQKKAYLEAEKKKMDDVNALMEQSIKEAKALLKEQ